jgi:DNA-binding GntR family transcriptional regulator
MLERRHLREQLGELIRDRIVHQRLPVNQSVGEVALAEELGVSRTPVRETLLGLERDGFVRAVPGRGFVVQPLSAEEAQQLYPIVWGLETLALREAERVPPERIAELRAINERLAAAETPEERTRRDSEWHRCLVSTGGNARLLKVLDGLKASIARYEHAFLDAADRRDHSVAEHEAIIRLLEKDPALAAAAIETHWRDGLAVVLAAISAR